LFFIILTLLRKILAEDRDNYAAKMEIYSIFMSTRHIIQLFTTPWANPLIDNRLFKSAWDNTKSPVTLKHLVRSLTASYEYSNRFVRIRAATDFIVISFQFNLFKCLCQTVFIWLIIIMFLFYCVIPGYSILFLKLSKHSIQCCI